MLARFPPTVALPPMLQQDGAAFGTAWVVVIDRSIGREGGMPRQGVRHSTERCSGNQLIKLLDLQERRRAHRAPKLLLDHSATADDVPDGRGPLALAGRTAQHGRKEIESRLAEEYRQGRAESRRVSHDFAAVDKEGWPSW